jgi:hypothetical protein
MLQLCREMYIRHKILQVTSHPKFNLDCILEVVGKLHDSFVQCARDHVAGATDTGVGLLGIFEDDVIAGIGGQHKDGLAAVNHSIAPPVHSLTCHTSVLSLIIEVLPFITS